MTITEIANHVCGKIGRTDSEAVAKAKAYAKAAAAMLWQRHLWKQSKYIGTASVAAGNAIVVMPPEIQEVLAMRWGDADTLRQLDMETLLQLNPQDFEREDRPGLYDRLGINAEGRAEIRLFSVPTEAGTLLVLGKRPAPTLADSDTCRLPAADQMLLCLCEAEMLEWQRQYAKGQAKQQEAWTLHWPAMLNIETSQAAHSPRMIPMDMAGSDRDARYDGWLQKG